MIINMTGGGGSGGTLVVTAPLGVTVTATKDGKTYTRAVNAEGKATFRGLSSGTWMLNIDDAEHEPSTPVPVEIRADYTVTLKFFAATINVTYPAGSTLTCTDGTITLTAPDTSGSYSFIVPNAGTWTVSSTNGSQSDSEAVSITADGQSVSVTLAYFSATINITYPAASTCVVTDSGGAIVASDSNTGSSAKTWTATVTTTGTYTVTATTTDGSGNTKSSNVSITANGQSASVELEYGILLYDNGDLCTDVTGGWIKDGTNAAFADTTLSLSNTGAVELKGSFSTANKINLSQYSKLIARFFRSDEANLWLGLTNTTTGIKGGSFFEALAAASDPSLGYVELDISAITGSFHVTVSSINNGFVSVTEIMLL